MNGLSTLRLWRLATTVAAATTILIAGCGSGGDANAQLKLQLSLLSSASCYGTHILLPLRRTGAKVTKSYKADCSIATDADDAGCSATTSFANETLTLDLRGCFVSNDDTLFDCELRGYRTNGPATVQCGCGCQDSCPNLPSICVTQENHDPCNVSSLRESSTAAGSANATAASVSEVIVATSTTTTPCGTCCDVGVDFDATLDDAVTLSELAFEIDVSTNEPNCPQFDGCTLPVGTDGPSYVRESNDTVQICVSDSTGFSGPAVVASCSMISDGGIGTVNVQRALDDDLRPVTPLPAVSVQPQ